MKHEDRHPLGTATKTTTGILFVGLLGALTMLPPLSIDVSLPGLPLIAGALRASAGAVQASLSVFIFAFGVGQLVVGPLSDRYGRRPVLLAGLAIFTVSGVGCTIATNVSELLLARFVQGVGACAGTVVARAVVQDISRERTRAATLQAFVAAVNSLAPMLAPLLGVAILAVTGWRWLYGALIVVGVSLFVAVLVRLPETARGASGDVMAAYRRALALPRTIALAAFSAFAFGAYFALISGSPFALVAQMHVPRGFYAIAFGCNAFAALCGSLATGRFAGRVGAERVFAFGVAFLVCAGVAACIFDVLIPNPMAFVTTFAAVAFAFGVAAPSAFAAALADSGPDAGLTAGVLGAAQMLGGATGSSAAGNLPLPPAAATGTMALVLASAAAAAYIWSRAGEAKHRTRTA